MKVAAVRDQKGHVENGIMDAINWLTSSSFCSHIFSRNSEAGISFGHHLNDSSSLIIDLNNRYSELDLATEVNQLLGKVERPELPNVANG